MAKAPQNNIDLFESLGAVRSAVQRAPLPDDVEELQREQHQAEPDLPLPSGGQSSKGEQQSKTALQLLLDKLAPEDRADLLEFVHRERIEPNDPMLFMMALRTADTNALNNAAQQILQTLEDERMAENGVKSYFARLQELAREIETQNTQLTGLHQVVTDVNAAGLKTIAGVVDKAAFRGVLKAGLLLLAAQGLVLLLCLLFR